MDKDLKTFGVPPLFFGILLLLLGWSCSQQAAPKAAAISDPTPQDTASNSPIQNHDAKLASLQSRRDTLATHFELKRQNLPLASYYHKTWRASYYVPSKSLHAGVDSNGVVFLIHSYRCNYVGPLTCQGGYQDLQVEIGDTSFVLQASQALKDSIWGKENAVQRDPILSTGWQCSDYYILEADALLLQMLADSANTNVSYFSLCDGRRKSTPERVGKRNRAALQDCAQLGMVLREIAGLRGDGERY